jgi:two-component system phosphate regulon sensor histidine kinase PhoR
MIAFFSLYLFEKRNEEVLMSYLLEETQLKYDSYEGTPILFASTYSESSTRITILDENGYVLADSKDAEIGQDKSQRPEILNLGQVYSRTSDTIDVKLLYIAKQLDNNQYLRISVPLEIQTNIFSNIVLIIGLTGIIIIVGYYYGINKVNQHLMLPFEKIKKGMSDLSEGKFQVMSLTDKYDDINEMLYEMNMINLSTSKHLKQVEAYQAQLNVILNQLQQAVLLFDQNENLTYFNDDAKILFSLSNDDLNQKIYKVIRDIDLKEAIHLTNENHKMLTFDMQIKDKTYETKTLKLQKSTSLSKQPTILVILKDVSKERQLSQVKRDFFSYASHELKSPITAISGNAELIFHGMIKDEKEIKEAANLIHHQAVNMALLVEDMLTLSRLEQVKSKKYEKQNLNVILNSTFKNLKDLIVRKEMDIIVDETDVSMMCDPLDIQKLFKNLIENAIKYSESNKQIKVMLHKKENDIIFSVKDEGFGISIEHQQRVFERFYRIDKGRLDGGTGLGLAIVKHIAIKYQGDIKLTSAIGQGTTIEILMKDLLK